MAENHVKRAVAYARFSSSMQREESIDAQIRAIEEFASRNGYCIMETYVDRAYSATSDQRPEFQSMIRNSELKQFDAVIVHKLDRFARSRYDSAHYKYLLKKNGISLLSVSENLDDSPESVVLESVLEGMAEYYSKNLAREVEKGKRENALKGRHVGGSPPLGYCVDITTRQLVVEATEAAAVKMIFKLFLEGAGYTAIRNELNRNGFKTKRGQSFGKNSLHEILRNEKYTGVYVYNKSANRPLNLLTATIIVMHLSKRMRLYEWKGPFLLLSQRMILRKCNVSSMLAGIVVHNLKQRNNIYLPEKLHAEFVAQHMSGIIAKHIKIILHILLIDALIKIMQFDVQVERSSDIGWRSKFFSSYRITYLMMHCCHK